MPCPCSPVPATPSPRKRALRSSGRNGVLSERVSGEHQEPTGVYHGITRLNSVLKTRWLLGEKKENCSKRTKCLFLSPRERSIRNARMTYNRWFAFLLTLDGLPPHAADYSAG